MAFRGRGENRGNSPEHVIGGKGGKGLHSPFPPSPVVLPCSPAPHGGRGETPQPQPPGLVEVRSQAMREALLAGVVTIFAVGPLAAWAIVRVGTRKPTPAAARTNHPSAERRGERP